MAGDKNYKLTVEVSAAETNLEEAERKLQHLLDLKNQFKGKVDMFSDSDIKGLSELVTKTDEVIEATKKQKVQVDELTKAKEKLAQSQSAEAKELAEITLQTQAQNKANKDAAKETLGMVSAYDKLSNTLKDNKKAVKDLLASGKELSATDKQLIKDTQALDERIKKIDGTVGDHQRNVGNYKDALSALPAPFQAAGNAADGLGKTFKALIANPLLLTITLIIGALTAVFKAFQQTDEGATFVEGAMKGLSAVLDIVTGALLKVGKFLISAFENPKQAIIDLGNLIKENIINRFTAFGVLGEAIVKILSGDLKDGFKQLADGSIQLAAGIENGTDKIIAFGEGVAEAVKEGIELAKLFDKLSDAQREFSIKLKENERDITRLLLQAKNKTKADQERIDFLDEASRKEEENFKQQKLFAEENLRLIRLENEGRIKRRKLDDVNASLLDKERQKEVDALNAITALEQESFNLQEKIINRRDALQQELAEKNLKRIEKEKAAIKEKQDAELQAAIREGNLQKQLIDARIRNIKDSRDREIATERETLKVKLAEIIGSSVTENALRAQLKMESIDKIKEITAKFDKQEEKARIDSIRNQAKLEIVETENQLLQLGDKEIEKRKELEAKILDLKIKQLEKEKKLIEQNTDLSQDERLLRVAETENQILQLKKDAAEKATAIQQAELNKQIDQVTKFVDLAAQASEKRSQKELDRIAKEQADQQEAQRVQEARAEQGLSNTVETQQRLASELEIEREKEQRKEERRQKRLAFLSLVAGYAKQNASTAFQNALRDVALSEGALALFGEKGGLIGDITDTTELKNGKLSKTHKSGDRLLVASPNEGLLSERQMANLGGKHGFYNLQSMLANPMSDEVMFPKVPYFIQPLVNDNNKEVITHLKDIKQEIANKPVSSTDLTKVGDVITKTYEQGKIHTLKIITEKPRFKR